jgi:hypothetical protein
MKAESIKSTPEEQRRRDTVAYPARDEQDYEELLEEMERVEDEDVAQAVEEINEVVDGELRNRVMNHFQAPIRSLNNPEENTVELEEGTEVQIAGEEYASINGNLPGFGDVSDIKWWAAYDPNTYREETRADRSGEHLQFNREGELHGFRVEVDGEPVESQDVKRLARNLRIRRDNQVTDRNDIPELMLEYSSLDSILGNTESAVRSPEDIDNDMMREVAEIIQDGEDEPQYTKEGFLEEYREAEKLGLVTENGNLTLKGWLSAVDLEARDLRGLEELSQGAEGLELQSGEVPMLTTGDLIGARGNLEVEAEHSVLGYIADIEESGRVRIDEDGHTPTEEGSFSEIFDYLSSQGFSVDTDSEVERFSRENGRYRFNLGLNEAIEYFEGITLEDENNIVLEDSPESVREDLTQAALEETRAVEVESISERISLTEEDYEELSQATGIDPTELEETLQDNVEVCMSEEGVEVEYEGDSSFESRIAERLIETGEFGWQEFNSDGELDFSDYFRTSVPYITLLPFKDEIDEHTERENLNNWNEFDNSTVGFSQGIEDYDSLSRGARSRIERLEEEDILDVDFIETESSDFEIKVQDPLEYREVISELEEILHTESKTGSEPGVYLDRAEVEYDVRVETANIEAGTEDFDRLEEALDTRLDGKPGTVKGVLNWLDIVDYEEVEETVKDYERSYNDDLKHKLNALIDESEGVAEALLQGTVIPEPEEHEVTRRDYDFENMGGQVDLRDEEDRLGHSNRNIEDYMEEEGNFVQLLEELEEAGILEIEFDYRTDSRRSYGNEIDQGTIENFYSLEENQREKLENLRDRGLVDYGKPERRAFLSEGENFESFRFNPSLEAEIDEVYLEDTEVNVEANYHNEGAVYEPTEEAHRIADILNPMKLNSKHYGDIGIETEFNGTNRSQLA